MLKKKKRLRTGWKGQKNIWKMTKKGPEIAKPTQKIAKRLKTPKTTQKPAGNIWKIAQNFQEQLKTSDNLPEKKWKHAKISPKNPKKTSGNTHRKKSRTGWKIHLKFPKCTERDTKKNQRKTSGKYQKTAGNAPKICRTSWGLWKFT